MPSPCVDRRPVCLVAGLAGAVLLSWGLASGPLPFRAFAEADAPLPAAAPAAPALLFTISDFPDWVTAVAIAPDGKTLAAGSYEVVQVWDLPGRRLIGKLHPQSGFARALAFSPDGQSLAVGSYKSIELFDVATRDRSALLSGSRGYVNDIKFSPDGQLLASGGEDMIVRLWDVASRSEVRQFKGHRDAISGVAISADGQWLATAAGDETRLTRPGEVKLWSIATGELVHTFAPPEKGATDVAFSPDGTRLASTSLDEKVNIYDVESRQAKGFFGGHSRPTNCVLFAAGGRLVISGSGGRFKGKNEVLFWNPGDGQLWGGVGSHEGKVTRLALASDGHTLASASYDKTVCVWDISPILKAAGLIEVPAARPAAPTEVPTEPDD